jgi:transcriptional regulator with XRE-family HTH domain
MDAMHPIWHTPAAQEAAAAGHFGALIRMTRIARRLSLVRTGELVGYSASTLSRIETGQRRLTDVTQLRRFSDVLGIPPRLFGLAPTAAMAPAGAALPPSTPAPISVGEIMREGGDGSVRRREMLAGLVSITGVALAGAAGRLPGPPEVPLAEGLQPLLISEHSPELPPVGVQVLRRRLAAAHATFGACRYSDLAGDLPGVIATAHASLGEVAGEQHEQTAALLADAYSLASDLCSRLHDDALAWVTAERARAAAQISGDPTSIAEAARMASIALRRHGHHVTGTALLTSTAMSLGADSGDSDPGLLATYGSLLCTAAYTAAQYGSRSQALELIAEAESAAARLGGAQVPSTPFSPANVTIYQIGVHTALGDAGIALDHARKIDLRRIPTPERQARFCVDTARAWQRFGSTSNAFRSLQVAGRCAPEEVHRSSVRSLVVSLLDAPGPTPSGLREFAAHCGAVA